MSAISLKVAEASLPYFSAFVGHHWDCLWKIKHIEGRFILTQPWNIQIETMNLQNLKIIQLFAQLYDTDNLAFHITEDIKSINIKAQKTMKEIHSYFEGFNISIRTIESDKVVKGIQQFTNTHELDMLATIPKEHSFIDKLFKSSVTKKIALDLEVPLLTIQQF